MLSESGGFSQTKFIEPYLSLTFDSTKNNNLLTFLGGREYK